MGVEDRRRWLATYVLCVGMLMIVLDATIVNVALPTIQEDLAFSQNDLAWVVNAYLIAFGGLLLLSGRIGDLIGQRRVFLIGLGVFTGASLLCALAQSQGVLIGARFVQGVGGALTSAVILGMIVTMFPEPASRRGDRRLTFVAVAGGSIGLLLGGVLTETINWHWIFFVNIPIGVATALAAIRLVPDREGIGTAGADLPGAVLLTGGLMLFVYTILGVTEEGWGRPDAPLGSDLDRLTDRLRCPPGAGGEPVDAAAPVSLAAGLGEPGPGAAGGRDVRDVLPRRPLHAAHPRLRRAAGRTRIPAADHRHGHHVLPLHRAAQPEVRAGGDARPRNDLRRRRAALAGSDAH